ncbi:MAG: hypothetical protein ACRDYU_01505 [Actinomycetes bacterium]
MSDGDAVDTDVVAPKWPRRGVVPVAAVLVGVVCIRVGDTGPDRVRYLGLSMELAGLGTLAWGLLVTRRDLGLYGLGLRARQQARRVAAASRAAVVAVQRVVTAKVRQWFPRSGKPQHVGLSGAAAGASTASGTMTIVTTLSGRVDALENALARERENRVAQVAWVRAEWRDLAIGGLRIERVGVGLLLAGLVFTTLPVGTSVVLARFPLFGQFFE